jgi:DNA topoisomerase-2
MGKKSEPEITVSLLQPNSTRIILKPDLAKFHMTQLDDDVIALMTKRVFDMVSFLGMTIQVQFNGEMIIEPVESFSDHVFAYQKAGKKSSNFKFVQISNKHLFEICYGCKCNLVLIVLLII